MIGVQKDGEVIGSSVSALSVLLDGRDCRHVVRRVVEVVFPVEAVVHARDARRGRVVGERDGDVVVDAGRRGGTAVVSCGGREGRHGGGDRSKVSRSANHWCCGWPTG